MSHKKSRHAKDLPAVAPIREGDLTTPSLKPQDEAKLAQLLTKLQPQRKDALVPMSAAKARRVLATPVARRTQPPIETLKALRQVLNSPANVLILDLEFYGTGAENTHVGQLAGRIFGRHEQFNYTVFQPSDMAPVQQLKFLKTTNFTYQEAIKFNLDTTMRKIQNFIQRQPIDYLLSYDNHFDLHVLNGEAQRHQWPAERCFWQQIQLIDLAAILKTDALNGKAMVSLRSLVGLLGLRRELPFHEAQNDVEYINRVLQIYALDANQNLLQ